MLISLILKFVKMLFIESLFNENMVSLDLFFIKGF